MIPKWVSAGGFWGKVLLPRATAFGPEDMRLFGALGFQLLPCCSVLVEEPLDFYQLCKSWLACYRAITPIWGQRELITPIPEHFPPCTKLQLFVIQYDLSMLWKPLQLFNYLCHNGLEIEACPYGPGLWNCVIVTQVSSLAVIPHWCCRHTCLKKEEDVCFNYVYIYVFVYLFLLR